MSGLFTVVVVMCASSPFPDVKEPKSTQFERNIKPIPIKPTTIMIFLIFLLSSIDFSFELVLSSIIHSVIMFGVIPKLS